MRCLCVLILLSWGATATGASTAGATLQSEDTRAHVEVRDNRLFLTGLGTRDSAWDWIDDRADTAGSGPLPIPFVEAALVDGRPVTLTWRYAGSTVVDGVPRRHIFSFVCTTFPLELKSIWSVGTGPGPIEHAISILNRGQQVVTLPLQTSLMFSALMPAQHRCEHWWVEKGANQPTPTGTHKTLMSGTYTADLVSLPYARDGANERDPIPWTAIQDIDAGEGWYAGVEFSGRVHIGLHAGAAANGRNLTFEAGLLPEEENTPAYRTRVLPGATFETPTVFVGCYRGDVDMGANHLHRWLDTALRPSTHDPDFPLLISEIGALQTPFDAARVRAQTDDAVTLGLEMIQLDAGWYRSVGDWLPDVGRFPDGLAPLADNAHHKGLKIGLSVGWTQGGRARGSSGEPAPLSVDDSTMQDWFAHDYPAVWKPTAFVGADVCLGDPRAVKWCRDALERIVREDRVDLLECDQPMMVDACTRADHLHTDSATDIAYQAAIGFNQVYDGLRARNPALLLSDSVHGGHTVDYGIVRRTHSINITAAVDPVANRRAFYDASYALPPAMCQCRVADLPGTTVDDLRYALRSAMMGGCTVVCDTLHWTTEQRETARRQFTVYKSSLRPLIAGGDLYHIASRPDGVEWDGIEYFEPRTGRGVVFAFRGTGEAKMHRFVCKGLDRDARYQVRFEDGTGATLVHTGAELMNTGIEVRLSAPQTSELIYLERVTRS
jgi:alpha-galactosidase